MKDEISLVLSCDDNFAQHAGVLMESVLSNAKHRERLHFYLMDGGISERKRLFLSEIVEGHGAQLSYLKIDEAAFKGIYLSFQYTLATYYRLCTGELLPQSVDRCIYLDCDMVCCADIEALWEESLDGFAIGAVIDHGMMVADKRWKEKKKELGFDDSDQYFNAGLLLIDLKQWRSRGLDKKAMDMAHGHDFKNHDQDILNVLFQKSWKVLNSKWNCMPAVYGFNGRLFRRRREFSDIVSARKNPGILHFAGRYKPWEYPERKGFSDSYYKNLNKTPFAEIFQPKRSPQNINKSGLSEWMRICAGNVIYSLFG